VRVKVARTTAILAVLSLTVAACSSDSKSSDASTADSGAGTTTIANSASPTSASTADTQVSISATPATEPVVTDAPTTTEAPTTTAAPKVLEVLVTDDDGYNAPGIDAVVEYLRTRADMHVTVVAPATNQSGAGDKSTDGQLVATDVTTASGYPAKAVAGFPADSVNWALGGGIPVKPDLIVSGSNLGQNYGPLTTISGTVGAAATGARKGIHGISISQGFPAEGQAYDFPSSITVLTAYLNGALSTYRDGTAPLLVSINVPTCPAGVALLPTLELPSATGDNGRPLGAVTTCDGTPASPVDDIDGFNAGHAVISVLDPTTLTAA
jgi:5'-nucleotidase